MDQFKDFSTEIEELVDSRVSSRGAMLGRVVEVNINVSNPIFVAYVQSLYDAMFISVKGRESMMRFTELDLFRYCATIIRHRCAWVRRLRPTIKANDRINTPDYIYVLSQNIGICVDPDTQLELTPNFICLKDGDRELVEHPEEGTVELFSDDEMLDFSRQLELFSNLGFVFARGYAKQTDGNIGAMTCWHVHEEVISHSVKSHPVVALMSASLNLHTMQNVLNPVLNYGPMTQFRSLVQLVATPRGGARK